MRHIHFLAIALAASSAFAIPTAQAIEQSAAQNQQQTAAIVVTRLKAEPGEQDNLAAFIIANWFAMDEIAVEKGLFTSYRLFENPVRGGDWDLAVEVGYPTSLGYDDPQTRSGFEAIRAAHQTVLIDGKGLRELGSVVGSERMIVREGSE